MRIRARLPDDVRVVRSQLARGVLTITIMAVRIIFRNIIRNICDPDSFGRGKTAKSNFGFWPLKAYIFSGFLDAVVGIIY